MNWLREVFGMRHDKTEAQNGREERSERVATKADTAIDAAAHASRAWREQVQRADIAIAGRRR